MKKLPLLRIAVHLAGWLPLLQLILKAANQQLTANPIQAIEQETGLAALSFLVLSLACTPLSALTGFKALLARRKALGMYGFFYACLHFIIFLGVDYAFNLRNILRDTGTKPYILLGLAALLLLLPVGLTSTRYAMRRLGKAWKTLHRAVYIISPLVVIHFLLASKGNFTRLQGNLLQPIIYGVLVLILLLLRTPFIKNFFRQIRGG